MAMLLVCLAGLGTLGVIAYLKRPMARPQAQRVERSGRPHRGRRH